MTKKYRVILHSLIEDGPTFKARMTQLGAPADAVDKMVSKAPLILKGGLTLGAARRYAEAVQGAGGRVTIDEHGYFMEERHSSHSVPIASFKDFTMCPECGLKQVKGDICVKCGFRLC